MCIHHKTFLNQKRLKYPLIAGGLLWIGWFISILFGSGELDLAGQVVGADYLQFYAAGTTLRMGDSNSLYDFDFQHDLEQKIAGSTIIGIHGFITPPFLAWLFVPLAGLPYLWSFAVWSIAGLVGLWFSLHWLGVEHVSKQFPWALCWFPIFASISFGQNSLLSLTLLCLTYFLWRNKRFLIAGLVCSLMLYKPQLVLGIGLFWLLEWRQSWKALIGFACGGILIAGVTLAVMPEASIDYINFSRTILPTMLNQEGFPIWHAHTPRAFWQLILPGQPKLVDGLYGLSLAVGLASFGYFWHRFRSQPALCFAAAVILTLWATPHAMIYDWAIILLPAAILWQSRPADWMGVFALVWLSTFISGPLTMAQLKLLPFAVQISVPLLVVALVWSYKILVSPEQKGDNSQLAVSHDSP